MNHKELEDLRYSAVLHDIGKIGYPRRRPNRRACTISGRDAPVARFGIFDIVIAIQWMIIMLLIALLYIRRLVNVVGEEMSS